MEQDEQEVAIKEASSLFEHWCENAAEIERLVGPREISLRRIVSLDPGILAGAIRRQYSLGDGSLRATSFALRIAKRSEG